MCMQQVGERFTERSNIQGETRVIFNILSFWEVVTVHWPLVSETPVLEPPHVDLKVSHSTKPS